MYFEERLMDSSNGLSRYPLAMDAPGAGEIAREQAQ